MLKIGNREFRSLEEQVNYLGELVNYLQNEQGVLNQFGLKVVGNVAVENDLPTVEDYKTNYPDWGYGDCYIIGVTEPYIMKVLTRADETHASDYWFTIGQFPLPGPKGKAGENSDITVESTTTTLPGSLARVVNTGDKTHAKLQFYIPAGKKGDQGITPTVNIGTVSAGDYANVTNSGSTTDVILDFVVPRGPKGDSIKGDPGDSFKIIGTLNSTNQLPTPSESIRSNAYLIADNTGRKHLWVITGDTTLIWTDAGAITGVPGQAATISVGGTVTLPANSQASVENAGTSSDAVLNFSIPKGKDGSSATVSIGSVSTLPAGSQATVTNIGTSKDAVFNFGIPKGDKGNTGDTAQSITITESTATGGTLTDEQLATLQASEQNYIKFNNEIYRLNDAQHDDGLLIYSHTGQDSTKRIYIKEISITISTKAWILTKFQPQSKLTFDTTPTANSTNPVTSDGIYQALQKNNAKQYMIKIGQNVLVNAPLNINYILPWAYSEHGDPRGIVFSGKTTYNDIVAQYYPLTYLTDAVFNSQFSLQFRDCYLTWKNFKCTYDRNAVTLTASVKQQQGWKDTNVLDIYLVW